MPVGGKSSIHIHERQHDTPNMFALHPSPMKSHKPRDNIRKRGFEILI